MALLAYMQSVRKMAVLLSALLDTTLLQYCIFLGFATSFLRFPSHVSAFSVRFFACLVLVSRGLFSAFFLRFCGLFVTSQVSHSRGVIVIKNKSDPQAI